MKVLQLCKKSPTLLHDGESIAIHQMTQLLLDIGCQVDVLVAHTHKHNKVDKSKAILKVNYYYQTINTKHSILKLVFSLFSKTPYNVYRFFSKVFSKKLQDLLSKTEYDLVILEGSFLETYIPAIERNSKAKLVLRAHNVEYKIWEGLSNQVNSYKRYLIKHFIIPKLRKYEILNLQKLQGIISISSKDTKWFKKHADVPLFELPICANRVERTKLPNFFKIGYIGSLDWMPNRYGLNWFLQHVWSEIHKLEPSICMQIAGSNMPKEIKLLRKKNIEVLGEVPNSKDFIKNQSVIIVPLFSGGGMKVKVIEAMSLSKCVVSTHIGFEGIQGINKQNTVEIETAEEWVQTLANLKNDKIRLTKVSNNAAKLIKEKYLLNAYIQPLNTFLKLL